MYKKITKMLSLFMIVIVGVVMCAGCGSKTEKKKNAKLVASANEYIVYHVSLDSTKLVPKLEVFDKNKSVEKQVDDMMDILTKDYETAEYKSVIPENVVVETAKWSVEEALSDAIENDKISMDTEEKVRSGKVEISLSASFNDAVKSSQLLCKAAITRSLTQIEGVDSVSFTVDLPVVESSNELVNQSLDKETVDDASSEPIVETYTADSFVGDLSDFEDNHVQDVNIYFTNVDGDLLEPISIPINMDSNTSAEQQVIEQLISGTSEKGYYDTIPEGTTLLSVSTKDGVCFVDFSEEFLKLDGNVKDQIVLYSVVNSLCELTTVNKVAFTINGEQQELYNGNVPFNQLFEHNLDLVE